MTRRQASIPVASALLLGPAAHPLLIPLVGVPSHLLWWMHVLPVALVTYRWGSRGAAVVLATSAGLVIVGERTFGAGYGVPADWATVWALTIALTFTNFLIAGFALSVRRVARRYQVLFDASLNGVIRTDGAARVEAANPAALRLLGVQWNDLEGRTLADISQLRPLPDPGAIGAGGWSGTLHVGRAGESEVHVLAAVVKHEDPAGYQILLVDRTHDVAQEREAERQARLATLGEALAGVAHELRNPLGVITISAALGLETDATPSEMREGFSTVREQAQRMIDLVNELLGFSRRRDESRAVRVDELVARVIRMQRVARGRRIQILDRIEWKGDAAIPGQRLEQILVNLLSNAADAVPPGTGVIEVALRQDGPDLLLVVSDNGPGVPPQLQERIFEPFVTTKPEGVGTGLGLAISRRLAASMGASLDLASAPLGGAEFTLRLPLTRPEALARVREPALA